jgi:hypothetical protein
MVGLDHIGWPSVPAVNSPGNCASATKESAARKEHLLDRKMLKSYLAVTLALLLCEC